MKYKKKPVIIDAIQWDRTNEVFRKLEEWSTNACRVTWHTTTGELFITTLEGAMKAVATDWIVHGVKGELYPVRNDIFHDTYERAE